MMNVLLVSSIITAFTITMELIESFPIRDFFSEIRNEVHRKREIFNNLTDDIKYNYIEAFEKKCILLEQQMKQQNEIMNRQNEIMNRQNETLNRLNESLCDETKLRYFYQSLLDFTELIQGLVEECYPVWAKPRREDDFTDEIFETMFLNVEHSRILLLKIELKEANVLEAEFIKIVTGFLKFRKTAVHRPLSNTEREKTYPELLRSINRKQAAVLRSILRYSYNVNVDDYKVETLPDAVPKYYTSAPLPTTIDPRNLPLAENIIHNTNEKRKNRNLMVITNPQTWMLNEDELHNKLSNGTNKLLQDEPLACYVPNKKEVYILFKDFGSAYKALEKLQYEEEIHRGINGKKINYLIRTIHDFLLNDKNSVLKLAFSIGGDNSIQKSTNSIDELITRVKTCLDNNHTNVAYQTGKNRNNCHEVFLKFDNMEKLLMAYGKLKKVPTLAKVIIIEPSSDT